MKQNCNKNLSVNENSKKTKQKLKLQKPETYEVLQIKQLSNSQNNLFLSVFKFIRKTIKKAQHELEIQLAKQLEHERIEKKKKIMEQKSGKESKKTKTIPSKA